MISSQMRATMSRLSRRTTIESIAAESVISSVGHSAGHSPRAVPAEPDTKPGEPADVAAERIRAKHLTGSLSSAGSSVPALLLFELRKVCEQ